MHDAERPTLKLSPGGIATLAMAWTFAGAVAGAILVAWVVQDIEVGMLTRDPADSVKGPTYLGAVSSLGFAVWASAAAVCLLAGLVVRRRQGDARLAAFMFSAGILSTLLLVDDMWLLHDRVFPGNLGIPEALVYAFYGLFGITHLIVFRREILRTDFVLLLLAGLLLFGAIVIDTLTNNTAASSSKYFTEDIPKFFGMVTWLAYHVRTALVLSADDLESKPAPESEPVASAASP